MSQKPRKIPMRTCVGCFEVKPKKELIRIVRTPAGEILLDPGGKMSGRGAYICKSAECLKKAQKAKRLEKALEAEVSPQIYGELAQSLEALEKSEQGAAGND